MKAHDYWQDKAWNETKHYYTFPEGTVIEFKSIDKFDKAHGPRRDVLFLNEANYQNYKIVDQLITRTRKIVWMDWNPSAEFWFYTEMLNRRDDIDFITLTYLDNEALDQITKNEIESHRDNRNWWLVYGLGQLGEIEGRIYTGWQIIDEIPHNAKLICRWLDFGYSNDPSSLGDIYYYDGGYILDEQLYQTGMLNPALAKFISNLEQPQTVVIGDSAEPKSIDEIKMAGINILGVSKQRGESNTDTFVKWSIGLVQNQKISITKRSTNTIKEYRSYLWLTDRDGKIINEEDPKLANHSMAGIRYGFVYLLGKPVVLNAQASKPAPNYYPELGL